MPFTLPSCLHIHHNVFFVNLVFLHTPGSLICVLSFSLMSSPMFSLSLHGESSRYSHFPYHYMEKVLVILIFTILHGEFSLFSFSPSFHREFSSLGCVYRVFGLFGGESLSCTLFGQMTLMLFSISFSWFGIAGLCESSPGQDCSLAVFEPILLLGRGSLFSEDREGDGVSGVEHPSFW